MIDLVLVLCLRIIWGRYANANGDCIRLGIISAIWNAAALLTAK